MIATTLEGIPDDYLTALRTHCSKDPGGKGMEAAQLLGTQALNLGLETLDLAAIHRNAWSILESSGGTPQEFAARTRLARDFFAAALLPIEATHRTAMKACSNLERLNTKLARTMQELDHSTQLLERGTVARESAEDAQMNSEVLSEKLLDESRQLYSGIQEVARAVLSASEEERRALSLRLQDEIGQDLLGIHVRLLALEGEVTPNSGKLRKKVDLTQDLIRETLKAINGILREFAPRHES